jgi:hypothetical protein
MKAPDEILKEYEEIKKRLLEAYGELLDVQRDFHLQGKSHANEMATYHAKNKYNSANNDLSHWIEKNQFRTM